MFRTTTATKQRRRFAAATALVGALALTLTACSDAGGSNGGEDDAEPSTSTSTAGEAPVEMTSVTLTLNFLAGGPNAGFMVALENGYYEEVGLDVTIQEGQGSGSTASLVAQGNSEFGYADGPSAMAVAAQEGDLVIVAPILQTNGFSVMSLAENGLETIQDLEGKSVALQPGTAQASLFDAVLAANDVDPGAVEIVNIDPSSLVGSLLQGSVDAITAGADSQGVQLREQGADINEIMYRDAGVPTIGLSMIVTNEFAEQNPELVAGFVAASLRGWDDVRNDPERAAEIVAGQFPEGAVADSIVGQLGVDIELLCSAGSPGLGKPAAETWQATYDLLVEYLDLPTDNPIDFYYTEDFLPEDLPAC